MSQRSIDTAKTVRNKELINTQRSTKDLVFTAESLLSASLREMKYFAEVVGLRCTTKKDFKDKVIPTLRDRANNAIEAVNAAMPWNRATNRPL